MAQHEEYDYLLKLVLVGDTCVGKTSLLLRYTEDAFSEAFISTIGVDFKIKTRLTEGGESVKMQLWDTAGQDRFRAIVSSFYRGAHGLVMVFDVTDMESFNNISTWVQEAEHCAVHDHCVRVLVGNKIDKTTERVVTEEQARGLAQRLGMEYIETSAKTSTNVHKVLDQLSDTIVKNHRKEPYLRCHEAPSKVKLDGTREVDSPGYCGGYCGGF